MRVISAREVSSAAWPAAANLLLKHAASVGEHLRGDALAHRLQHAAQGGQVGFPQRWLCCLCTGGEVPGQLIDSHAHLCELPKIQCSALADLTCLQNDV